MPDAAEAHLLEAFAHAVTLGRTDCLVTHYRFRSALHCVRGELEQAIAAYGITAIEPKDKEHYERLHSLMTEGRCALARAWLLRLGDDIVGALAAAEADDSEAASRLRIDLMLELGKLEVP